MTNENAWGVKHRNIASTNSGVSDLDHGDTSLLFRTDIDSHASIVTVGKNVTIINDAGRSL